MILSSEKLNSSWLHLLQDQVCVYWIQYGVYRKPECMKIIINTNKELGRRIEDICHQESSFVLMSCDSPFGIEKAHSRLQFISLGPRILGEPSQGINPDINLTHSHQASAMYSQIMPSGMEDANIKDVTVMADIPMGA